ncbi:VanZ family protein [Roseateles amylovorans]|uniref:VanZ family protein n=1 Tax=Roseateles amylovorans TaxID=2978473 RepID=A0ABY6B5M2_9BURK|nr:VanZ family protein [Roseateles amylovorans]UXH79613.1 VanZ family protein [Roseateles amylovorans]
MIDHLLFNPQWRLAWRVLFLALVTVISWLAFSPHPPQGADLGWDKANHFAAFGTLAVVGLQCLRPSGNRRWAVLTGLLAYGILIEWVQSHVPGRDADARDVVADMIGAALGVGVHLLLTRLAGRRRSAQASPR